MTQRRHFATETKMRFSQDYKTIQPIIEKALPDGSWTTHKHLVSYKAPRVTVTLYPSTGSVRLYGRRNHREKVRAMLRPLLEQAAPLARANTASDMPASQAKGRVRVFNVTIRVEEVA